MSSPRKESLEPMTHRDQLVAYIEAGCKPKEKWRIGTEHEKFAFRLSDLRPLPHGGPDGIAAMLTGLQRFGWSPVHEGGNLIALTKPDGCSVTLEPGGQLELSGAPVETLHQTCEEVQQHLAETKAVGSELRTGLLGIGFQPKWRREDIPWMPKGRYKIMRDYMPKKGKLGLDMMLRTCTVQVNLDFESESCMVRKFRLGLALQPIATALFANSPFADGKPTGFLSYRSFVWTDTDPDRCGILPFVFEDGMGFERYVDYMLDVPMYFVYRDGRYIDASGQSFRDFLAGKLPAYPNQLPTVGDWEDHLTTVFAEVRLKRFLEMRGADGGPWSRLCALPALWVGLLYDATAMDEAFALVQDWTAEDHAALRRDVPRLALNTQFRGRPLRELAREVLAIARKGLERRGCTSSKGRDECHYLDPLDEIAELGMCPAEELLESYRKEWGGNVDPVFRELAY
jgi:glutamate--cysteine ligase